MSITSWIVDIVKGILFCKFCGPIVVVKLFSRTAQLSLSSLVRPFFALLWIFFGIFGTYAIHYYTVIKFLKCVKFVSSFSSRNGKNGFYNPISLQNWENISFSY